MVVAQNEKKKKRKGLIIVISIFVILLMIGCFFILWNVLHPTRVVDININKIDLDRINVTISFDDTEFPYMNISGNSSSASWGNVHTYKGWHNLEIHEKLHGFSLTESIYIDKYLNVNIFISDRGITINQS